jgi:hypothetical protein
MQPDKRNLFLTKTAIGVYVSFAALWLGIAPNVEGLITRNQTEKGRLNTRDYIAIITGVVGAIGTLAARYDAGGTYTPKYLPGDDPLDPPLQ